MTNKNRKTIFVCFEIRKEIMSLNLMYLNNINWTQYRGMSDMFKLIWIGVGLMLEAEVNKQTNKQIDRYENNFK